MLRYSWPSSPIHDERMLRFIDAGLYLVTTESASAGRSTEEIVQAALGAGVRLVQIREKDRPVSELVTVGRRIRQATRAAGALLIVNDRLDVAMAVDADGVHLGDEDLPVADARRLAPDMIVGASTYTRAEADAARAAGASYVAFGPLYATRTKDVPEPPIGPDGLRQRAAGLDIPVIAIGGIGLEHVEPLCDAGACGLAVVSAVTNAPDPGAAAEELLARIRKAKHE